MPTTKQAIKEVFFEKIENDESFFEYYNLPDNEVIELVNKRADNLLRDAVAFLKSESVDLKLTFEVNEDGDYVDDFSDVEIDLLAEIMNFLLFKKDYNRLKNLDMNFTPSDLQVFSPSNSRKTFLEMYSELKHEVYAKIQKYNDRDNATNQLKTIDYSSWSDTV